MSPGEMVPPLFSPYPTPGSARPKNAPPQVAAAGRALGADSTMGAILAAHPTAKVVLFEKFHIGGCSSCAYTPEQTLREVRDFHRVQAPIEELLRVIKESAALEARLHSPLATVRGWLASGDKLTLLDVRSEAEWKDTRIPGARFLTPALSFEILDAWPKDTRLVTYSNRGDRSLDKAAYFRCYGMTDATSLDGGLRAWLDAGARVESGAPASGK